MKRSKNPDSVIIGKKLKEKQTNRGKIIRLCAIASKIYVTPKGVYLPISKLHSILAVANLLALNNKSRICYCGQILLQSAAVNCCLSDTIGGNINFAGDGTTDGNWDLLRNCLSLDMYKDYKCKIVTFMFCGKFSSFN